MTSSVSSLQELTELSAIQQNASAHVAKHLEKREAAQPVPATPMVAESHVSPHVEPDPFARPSNAGPNPASQLPASDRFAPAIASAIAIATSGESLRIVPADSRTSSESLRPHPWGSAKKTQEWLETVKTHRGPTAKWVAHQWQTRRANIYIGVAGLILVIVITGWGIRPPATAIAGNASPATSGQHQAPPAPKLTPFEKMLVSLGLAEAPPAPIYLGNPDTQVWVDVHTALYHCPGSDLFGKTPDGRLATQRDAQQDQFEPANRKACP